MTLPVRAKPFITQMRRGRLPACSCRHHPVDGPERPSGRNASPSGITPSNIMSPAPEPTRGSRTEVRLGARAHKHRTTNRAHAPPTNRSSTPDNRGPQRLTRVPCTSKEQGEHARSDAPRARRRKMSGVTGMAVVVASCSGSSGSGWGGSAATTSSAHMAAPTTSAQPLKLLRPLKPSKQPSARRGARHANATLARFNTADGISLDGAMVGTGTVGVVMTHEYDNDLCGAWPFANYPAKRACASSPLMCAASAALSVPRATPPAGWSTTSSPPSLSCANVASSGWRSSARRWAARRR